jgi:hypothetical protein
MDQQDARIDRSGPEWKLNEKGVMKALYWLRAKVARIQQAHGELPKY